MAKQKKAKGSPFGEKSRAELLEQHLDAFGEINAGNAWKFVYEELLWFDRSTGLVHLYESDKVRPAGRHGMRAALPSPSGWRHCAASIEAG